MIFVNCDMAEDPRAVGRGPQHEIDVADWPLDAGVCERIVKQAQRELAEDMYEAWGIEGGARLAVSQIGSSSRAGVCRRPSTRSQTRIRKRAGRTLSHLLGTTPVASGAEGRVLASPDDCISHGQLDEWGKTERSAQRRTAIPSILVEDLVQWRAALRRSGHPARDVDFVIPGDLGCARHRARKLRTGAPYLTEGQAKRWGQKCFKDAVGQVTEMPEFAEILGATPYALRRGGISLRLRAEDPQTVAKECGTSLKMLSAHYAFAIDDLRRFEPRPVDVEWRAARAAQVEGQTQEQAPLDGPDREDRRGRRKVFGWFATRRWATRVS